MHSDELPPKSESQLTRELREAHAARLEAEVLLESKSESLWRANQKLQEFAASLEQRVNERTRELRQARDHAVEAERHLIAAKEAADTANRAKSDFLANMSHEIRTPLAAIVGYADLLSTLNLPDPQFERWISHLRVNADHLMTLINDVLDLSKIEAGRLQVDLQPTYLADELFNVMVMLEPQAQEKGLHFELRASGPLPTVITSDATRLRQILVNLGGNAVKFTQRGQIWLEATLVPGPSPALRLAVGDTGDGIPKDNLEEIFRPFHQVAPTSRNGRAGTGLGLDISQKLAHALGGSLDVVSTLGVGSVFTLTLPLAREEARNVEPMELDRRPAARTAMRPSETYSEDLAGLRVLLVDDGPDNRRILSLILKRAGATVRAFPGGEALLDYLMTPSGMRQPPAAILMDLQMPTMDGFETTQRLRSQGVQVPIIALSVDVEPATRERTRQAGFDAHLPKPAQSRELVMKILQLQRRGRELRRPGPSHPQSAPETPSLPQWILDHYLSSLEEHRVSLIKASQEGDTRAQRLLSHRLAGSGTSYGFPEITQTAKNCERALDDGAAPVVVKQAFTELVAAIDHALGK